MNNNKILSGLCFFFISLIIPLFANAQDDHGNDREDATVIVVNGNEIDGVLDEIGDVDFFSFPAIVNNKYIIKINELVDNNELQTKESIFIGDSSTLYYTKTRDNQSYEIELIASETTTYYISIESNDATNDYIGPYTITVANVNDLVEEYGIDINTDGAKYNGNIEDSNDVNYFIFNASNDHVYQIDIIMSEGNFDPIVVTWPYSTSVSSITFYEKYADEENLKSYRFATSEADTIYMYVKPGPTNEFGPYTISITTYNLGNTCDPCTADIDCKSKRCGSFTIGSNRCVPFDAAPGYQCEFEISDEGSSSGSGCFINTVSHGFASHPTD